MWIFLNDFFQKKSFRNTISVKQFGSRSGPMVCWAWSGSKMFAKVISRRQKLPLRGKELRGVDTFGSFSVIFYKGDNFATTCTCLLSCTPIPFWKRLCFSFREEIFQKGRKTIVIELHVPLLWKMYPFALNQPLCIATDKALFSSKKCWYLAYFSTKTCCGYSSEAPRQGASNE